MVETRAVSRRRSVCAASVLLLLLAALGCDREDANKDGSPNAVPSTPSPNARILPAPLPTVRGSTLEPPADGRTEPAALASGVPLPPEPFPADREIGVERSPTREAGLFELRGEFVWPEVEPRVVESPGDGGAGVSERRRPTTLATRPELRLLVVPSGHLTIEFVSPTHALPPGSQLRARSDRWGHVVVWPDQRSYRIAPLGSLRAVLNERRVDVSPLLAGQAQAPTAGRRLGHPTLRREVTGPLGRVTLEAAQIPGSGAGGALVCRFLLELGRLRPSSELCGPDELPVEAHYAWDRGGELLFRVTSLQRHATWPASEPLENFDIPPVMPIFKPGELPPESSPLLWSAAQRVELWGNDDSAAELQLTNPLEVPMYVIVDRIPLLRVPAAGSARWQTARRSRSIGFRDFLGEHVHAPRSVEIPGELLLGPPPPPPPEPVAEIEEAP